MKHPPCPSTCSQHTLLHTYTNPQFPFLVDPNTGKQMYESDEIITYLFNEYGDGQVMSRAHWIAPLR